LADSAESPSCRLGELQREGRRPPGLRVSSYQRPNRGAPGPAVPGAHDRRWCPQSRGLDGRRPGGFHKNLVERSFPLGHFPFPCSMKDECAAGWARGISLGPPNKKKGHPRLPCWGPFDQEVHRPSPPFPSEAPRPPSAGQTTRARAGPRPGQLTAWIAGTGARRPSKRQAQTGLFLLGCKRAAMRIFGTRLGGFFLSKANGPESPKTHHRGAEWEKRRLPVYPTNGWQRPQQLTKKQRSARRPRLCLGQGNFPWLPTKLLAPADPGNRKVQFFKKWAI